MSSSIQYIHKNDLISHTDINAKLTKLYTQEDANFGHNWNTGTDIEFFYINIDANIIGGSVRINNDKQELDYGFLSSNYRKKGYFTQLCNARIKYIKKTKIGMYYLYTEKDYYIRSILNRV